MFSILVHLRLDFPCLDEFSQLLKSEEKVFLPTSHIACVVCSKIRYIVYFGGDGVGVCTELVYR